MQGIHATTVQVEYPEQDQTNDYDCFLTCPTTGSSQECSDAQCCAAEYECSTCSPETTRVQIISARASNPSNHSQCSQGTTVAATEIRRLINIKQENQSREDKTISSMGHQHKIIDMHKNAMSSKHT